MSVWSQVHQFDRTFRFGVWLWGMRSGLNADDNLTNQHRTMGGNSRMNTSIAWSHRRVSLTAGILYLLTFVSIPTLVLYNSVKGENYVVGSGSDNAAIIGGLLEIIVGVAGIGTAVVLFAVLKKQNEELALGLVASRTLEAATIFVGVAFILAIVTLRKDQVGADGLVTSQALAALYNRIFLLGQSFMPAINDALLGFLLYQSRLVPRALSWIGLIGSPVLIIGWLAVLFGAIERDSSLAKLSALPVALFEFALGIWLVVKGFNSQAVAALESRSSIETSEP